VGLGKQPINILGSHAEDGTSASAMSVEAWTDRHAYLKTVDENVGHSRSRKKPKSGSRGEKMGRVVQSSTQRGGVGEGGPTA